MLYQNYVDLHLHIDGSVSPTMARILAQLGGPSLDEHTDAELFDMLTADTHARDLNLYLSKFNLPLALLQTPEQLEECTYLLQEDLRARGLLYAELRFAPQHHGERGMGQREAVQAVLRGLERSDFDARLILCAMRGRGNEAANRETFALAAEYRDQGVVAVDLAGAEALYPTAEFADLFAYARELGLPFTIHAGEAAGPESVRAALDFGATRIGHGVTAAQDPHLLADIAERGVTLELCPTSEVQTGAVETLRAFPLRSLMESGVSLTVNADNMSVSCTDACREFLLMTCIYNLNEYEAGSLLLNAVDASFADEATKARLRKRILS